jgi:hypothetical protein
MGVRPIPQFWGLDLTDITHYYLLETPLKNCRARLEICLTKRREMPPTGERRSGK